MRSRVMDQTTIDDAVELAAVREEGFCPECGQSLDVTRHGATPTGQRSREAYFFAILGVVLVVVFGINAWYAHRAIVAIDQQIVDSRATIAPDVFGSPSDQERVVTGTVTSYLAERLPIQQRFDQELAGIALGVVTTTLGVGTLIRQRYTLSEPNGSSGHGLVVTLALKLWDFGESVTRPLVCTVLMLCAGLTVDYVIRGEPLTLDLLDRALEHTVAIVVTMTSALS